MTIIFHRIKLIYYHQIMNSKCCNRHLKFSHHYQIIKEEHFALKKKQKTKTFVATSVLNFKLQIS